ncbi:MAG: GDSL-type esterase/lipase family protein, partial [Candidatus Sericytochromatia bacterium]
PASGTLLVAWHGAEAGYGQVASAPRAYRLLASDDSTNGSDGTWRALAAETANVLRSRVDTVSAPGARWLRLEVDATGGGQPLALRELEVHRAAAPEQLDAWLILGDSITEQSFHPGKTNHFSPAIAQAVPGHSPLIVGGGTYGETAYYGARRLTTALPLCPPGSFVGLAYGTNDAYWGVTPEDFKRRVQAMIDHIRASGRTPMLARPPYTPRFDVSAHAAVIDQLTAENGLTPGPDLYAWFLTHSEQLRSDGLHPTPTGEVSIQQLWAEAAAPAYAP